MAYGLIILVSVLPIILNLERKYPGKSNALTDDSWLAPGECVAIRGFAAIQILISHSWYYSFDAQWKTYFAMMFKQSACLWAGVFFFLSGYGLMTNYLKKGVSYSKGFLLKRVATVLIPYWVTDVIYILRYCTVTSVIDFKRICLSFVWPVFDSHAWFVFEIIAFYILFYLSMKVFRDHLSVAVSALVIAFIGFCACRQYPDWIWVSSICFPMGIVICTYKEFTYAMLKKYWFIPVVCLIAVYSITILKLINGNNIEIQEIVCNVLFVFVLISFLLFFKIKKNVYNRLGLISYEIYLIHHFFMGLVPWEAYNPISIIFVAVSSVAMAIGCKAVSDIAISKINSLNSSFHGKAI